MSNNLGVDMNVEDIMVKNVITVDKDEAVSNAVDIMNEHNIGCLIVVSDGIAIGILTERDLLKRVLAKSKDPRETKVREVMTRPLIYVGPDTDIDKAKEIMSKFGIKKLPVIDSEGRLVGLLTVTDIANSLERMLRKLDDNLDFAALEMP